MVTTSDRVGLTSFDPTYQLPLTSIGPTTRCADNSTYLRTPCGFWGCAQITPSYLRSAVSARRRKWLEKGSRFEVQSSGLEVIQPRT